MNTDSHSLPSIEIPCIHCGACCRWEGEVKITDSEITRISQYLGLSEEEFIATSTQLRANRRGLGVRMLPDGTCIFLDEKNLCRIHSVKPAQCAGYPLKWRNENSDHLCHAVQTLIKQGILPPSLEG